MIARKQRFITNHPLKAGLMWAAMFVPLFIVVQFAFGRPVQGAKAFGALIVLALVGGLFWGYFVRAVFKFFEVQR